ncbi:MAG TPA: GAF domain-containing sensor histidine kinase, partial [Anaerolineales bacterium]|nr:GAF domain-containing sensor histidine kinase [Anaerolineales bacterium]
QVVSLVDQAAAVIQSHRLYDGTLKRALELETVAQLGAIATMQTKPEELIHTMAVQTVKRFNLFHADVYLLNEDTKVLALAASAGEGEQWMTQIPFDEQDCLVAQVAQTRQGIICNDLTHGARFLSQLIETGAQSGLAVPLMTGDRLLGVLAVYSSLANVFKEDDIRIKSVLAAQLVAAYENARLFTEIQEAAQRLKELDKLKSEFLANMSHELRTPLNSVIGYSEVLLMGLDGELSSEAQTDIQAIYDNGRHLLSLINDVLDLAKIEAGRIVLHKKPESVITLFEQAKTNNMGLLHKLKKPIEIKTEIAPNLPTVHVDPTRIVQVIGNLISNAIKYSDKGTVTLRGYPVEEWVNIEVEDQGIGIAPEDLGKVFDQFTQLDMSSTRKVEGTGLGLSITRHLVEMHGGTITVESELGIGSKFIVRLPTTETNGYHKN